MATDGQLKVYEELCKSYLAIDDFRAKLLGFLPLASAGGIIVLVNTFQGPMKSFLLPTGLFGFLITLGLFAYEIYGITKCHALIKAGKRIEGSLGIGGQFTSRPREVARVINEPFAAGIVYPAVLAAWTLLAGYGVLPDQIGLLLAGLAALIVLIFFFALTLAYNRRLHNEGVVEVERADVRVLYLGATNGREGALKTFDQLKASPLNLRGRKFYGTFDLPNDSYRACVTLEDTDDTKTLGLDAMTIPGGRYARLKLDNPTKDITEVSAAFDDLCKEYQGNLDPSRPGIEFYKSQKELWLFLPIRRGIAEWKERP